MNEDKLPDILQNLKILNEYIELRAAAYTKSNVGRPYRSEAINELAESLSAAQGEYVDIPFNRTSSSWSDEYSDLDIVMKYIRPVLSKNKLMFYQWTELINDGQTILHSQLTHSSGQWVESRIRVSPSRNDIKAFDSAMADYRRQQAIALLGVTLSGDTRDDAGEIDMAIAYEKVASGVDTQLVRTKASFDCISKEELDNLEYELNGHPDLAEECLQHYKIRSLADLPKNKYRRAIETIRKLLLYRKDNVPLDSHNREN